ncbi:unnamed protein product [Clonostachys rosea f. rosea IK726]|uniref:Uncharacterized protein n=1 Tax=Clonostachys rosea f. rosea IK726 TaxID=1349383 RepID=A0ACA9UCF8_BIOOC|nr:unnamed protein product [Clonostachys rosea f. rosea IK726]
MFIKMALKQNIQSLPMEVLDCVFSHMGDKESVKQSRLVSRAFNNAAAPYLIDEAQVRVTSKSLSRLEELCNHDIFSKSITDVTIILSQYDVSLAMDRSLFMQDCTGRLLRNMEMRERMGAYKWRRMIASRCRKRVPPFSFQDKNREDALQREIEQQLWQLMYFNPVLLKISEEGFDEKEATPFQQVAMRLYSRYRERCQDQERVRRGNNHIDRICSALAKLPNLCNLRFDDPYLIVDEELQASDFPDLGFDRRMLEHFDCILSPSRCLSDLLPLESPWQHLDTLILSYQPATIEDLRALVALQADTITTFKWDYGWLLSGRWSEAVEVLRGFRKLETVSLEYPKGERFGTRVTPTCDVPYEEMYSYILKETDVNPLIAENTS